MDTSLFAASVFLPGRYLLLINQKAVVSAYGSDELQPIHIKGSLQFWAGEIDWRQRPGDQNTPISQLQIGLMSSGVLAQPDPLTGQEATGRISIYKSLYSQVTLTQQSEGADLTIDAEVEMLYERLLYQQLLREAESDEDTEETPGETMRLQLQGFITPAIEQKVAFEVGTFSGLLQISATDDLNLIRTIEAELEQVSLYQLSGTQDSAFANAIHLEKTIWVQPIGFKDGSNDLMPTTEHIEAQLNTANLLWGPGCIHFEILNKPIPVYDNGDLKHSNKYSKIAASAYVDDNGAVIFTASPDEPKNVIEIFMVDDDLTNKNGGTTRRPGTGFDKVIISDTQVAVNNPQLLAHELGHVLNLIHPGETATGNKTTGSAKSVMAQNQAGTPHLAINTLDNCHAAANPAEDKDPPVECTANTVNWQI